MRAGLVVLGLVVLACGKTLQVDEPPDAGPAADAAPSDVVTPDAAAQDGGAVVAPPPPLPACPLLQCPSALPGDDCTDADCSTAGDVDAVGTVNVVSSVCKVSPGSYYSSTRPRVSARRVAGLAFRLVGVTHAANLPLTIARLGVDVHDMGERFELVVEESATIKLCEKADAASICTTSVPLPEDPVTIHLHGVVSTDDPPRASFALTVACGAPLLLPVTRPFTTGDIRGSVGCVEGGGGTCAVTFDDVVLFTAAE